MAEVVATIKIMPVSPEVDLTALSTIALENIKSFTGSDEMKSEEEPIAFGLKAINITFVMDESKGSTDDLEKTLSELEGVNSVEVTDVRRALG